MSTQSFPARVGEYDRGRVLGCGGMATVFEARSSLDQTIVALKVAPRDCDQATREWLVREAKVLSYLNHKRVRGLQMLLDSGEADGHSYIVMRLVRGTTLTQRLNLGSMPFSQALELTIKLAHILAACHAVGVIHRDLKPDNIMLTGFEPTIIDFGIAQHENLPPPSSSVGDVVGTIAYMAPEQLYEPIVTPAADVFGLGCILYRLMLNRDVREGRTFEQVISGVHECTLPMTPPPGEGISNSLWNLLRKILSHVPHQRGTMLELATLLEVELQELRAPLTTQTIPTYLGQSGQAANDSRHDTIKEAFTTMKQKIR